MGGFIHLYKRLAFLFFSNNCHNSFFLKDLPDANKGKHIVFESDDEVNHDGEKTTPQKASFFDEDDGSGSEEKQDFREKVKIGDVPGIFFNNFFLSFLIIVVVL